MGDLTSSLNEADNNEDGGNEEEKGGNVEPDKHEWYGMAHSRFIRGFEKRVPHAQSCPIKPTYCHPSKLGRPEGSGGAGGSNLSEARLAR